MYSDRDKQEFRLTLAYAALLGVLTIAYRLVPPYLLAPGPKFLWNLMPIGALGLFVGSRLPRGWSWLLPVGVMALSDVLLIGAYPQTAVTSFWLTRPIDYASFAAYALLGTFIPRESRSPLAIVGLGLLGSVQFFVVSNFTVWASGTLYPKTVAGLIECFVAGAPFYRGTLIADLVFPAVFFACHALLLEAYRTAPAREAV